MGKIITFIQPIRELRSRGNQGNQTAEGDKLLQGEWDTQAVSPLAESGGKGAVKTAGEGLPWWCSG